MDAELSRQMSVGAGSRVVVAGCVTGEVAAIGVHVRYVLGRAAGHDMFPGLWQLWAMFVVAYGLMLASSALRVPVAGRGAGPLVAAEVVFTFVALDLSTGGWWLGPVLGGLAAGVMLALAVSLRPAALRWLVPLEVAALGAELALVVRP